MRLMVFALVVLVGCGSTAPSSAGDQPMSNHAAGPTTNDPTIEALVARIDQDANPLHADITPAVEQLGELGPKVIPYLGDVLNAKDELTRLHAQRALERALERHFGFVPGQGWTKPDGEARFRALWIKNGNYDADGAEPAREASIKAWLTWSSTQRS
ncbi:MAG TPA: HEAT repeat domain-containing protein [Kofleriaceae bacterium]|jgi:hypothetical protein|nr:HEAT repeat domain-containing protein [Kofleriaceae bacterium]